MDKQVWEACREFEGVLLGQMLRQMRGRLPERGVLPGGVAQEVFWDQYSAVVGQEVARSSPLGIARMLYEAVGGLTANPLFLGERRSAWEGGEVVTAEESGET